MSNKFTPKAQNALNTSLSFACDMGHSYIGSEHILLGLMATEGSIAQKMLYSRGAKIDSVKKCITDIAGIGSAGVISPSDMTPRTKAIIEASAMLASQSGHLFIGTEHLLLAIASDRDCVAARILDSLGVSLSDIKADVESYVKGSGAPRSFNDKATAVKNRGEQSEKNAVSTFGRDLVEMAKKGKIDPIIGRSGETERLIQILCRRTKNNPCLIGEPGVGKTAVVEGLAQKIADDDVPEILRGKKVIALDLAGMIAGAKYRGEFEERLKKVLAQCSLDPDIIIFIDEIHTIVGAGAAEGAVDAANIIKPALARGELQVIGATTIDEYRRHIEKDAALERRFQSVTVGEPSELETVQILKGLRPKYEAHHKLTISDEAIDAAVKLSVRYITDRFLPDKAIDLIDEAAARLRLKIYTNPPEHRELERRIKELEIEKSDAIANQSFELAAAIRDKENEMRDKYQKEREKWEKRKTAQDLTLGESDVADIVTQWTKIPVNRLLGDENLKLSSLEATLGERIIGQDDAISTVASAIRRGRTGLGDPDRPIGSFIFAGQTGVGKTELCLALADALSGSEGALIRLDMSEYMEKHSVSKLIGSPPGYVGFGEGGQLCEKVRRNPYSIVLFDEIEKAHPDVFNILLQILEDGALTDSQGRRVNFKNTVVIMTTNLGAKTYGEAARVGFSAAGAKDSEQHFKARVEDELRRAFRPEFLNRVDEIIIFKPLGRDDLLRIVELMLSRLTDRIESTGVFIDFDKSVAEAILQKARAGEYGARPLRREITRMVENPYAEAMVRSSFKEGDLISSRFDGERVVFSKRQAQKKDK
ncbi:MAG: ATP-dependent Clp protease ATP-binding subunit [Ruminococcaceae bacterium]|nr:ATP-dependent Clp protease ATP-binding subunit [Oscillospiraceae bacterium]